MIAAPLSVSELNREVRQLLENSLMRVAVRGEVSNFSCPASGHWYFTLKDERAQVRCAMFKGNNLKVRQRPKNGDELQVSARVSLYEGRGEYQLIVDALEHGGEGALRRAYEQLRQKLQAEGLFRPELKQAIPSLPKRIGIITSPTGAAIQDMLTVLHKRFPAIPVLLMPVPVQGEEAAPAICRALQEANRNPRCDLLILGRGGGSLEDLWAFNEEAVVRAVCASEIPVISAVGHETDTTLTDFAADWRAPTPSAAAEKASPDQHDWMQALDRLEGRLSRRVASLLRGHQEQTEGLRKRLQQQMLRGLGDARARLNQLSPRLKHPGSRLKEALAKQQQLEERLHNSLQRHLLPKEKQRQELLQRLRVAGPKATEVARQTLESRMRQLHAVSPLGTLARGYAIVSLDSGEVVESAEQAPAGSRVTARLREGSLQCEVLSQERAPR